MTTAVPLAAETGVLPKSEPQSDGWVSLCTPAAELQLDFTLPTGQSFRWRRTGSDQFTGVIGQRVVRLRQLDGDVEYQVVARGPQALAAEDAAVLHDYFNLGTSLAELAQQWCAADARFCTVHPHLPGARMLRQDPVECLFQFVCSSNNHISRIHGMVERLCRRYGTPLHSLWPHMPPAQPGQLGGLERHSTTHALAGGTGSCDSTAVAGIEDGLPTTRRPAEDLARPAAAAGTATQTAAAAAADGPSYGEPALVQGQYFAFPTLDQLSEATEEALREDGFGYRAKFIVGSVAALREKPWGGAAWLHGLRSVPYQEAVEALSALPGVGPKVAACVCLFSLDKHEAIPVDTHVWQLATRYYTPHLKGKSLTKKIHTEVQAAFLERFGPYAGWAHNTLFISELASIKERIRAAPTADSAIRGEVVADTTPAAAAAAAAAAQEAEVAVLATVVAAAPVLQAAAGGTTATDGARKNGSMAKHKPAAAASGHALEEMTARQTVKPTPVATTKRSGKPRAPGSAAEGEGPRGLRSWRKRKAAAE
ncbi:hypothetical protein N2152v2_008955 [Parachlorella kessleri]